MKRKKRVDEIEKKMGDIDREYWDLIAVFADWKEAVEAGNAELALALREEADRWLSSDERAFTKLAYWPPDGANVTVSEWVKFGRYSFDQSPINKTQNYGQK